MKQQRLANLLLKLNTFNLKTKNIQPNQKADFFSCDSRKILKNTLFLAIKGVAFDSNMKVLDVIDSGAKIIFCSDFSAFEKFSTKYPDISFIFYQLEDTHFLQAILAEIFFDFPAKKLKFIGVTGTNGKTTIATIINHILRSSGKKTTLIGTVNFDINGKVFEATHTTPDPLSLQKILADSVTENVEFVVMEISSHAAAQRRLGTTEFDVLAFTNLTGDHLDYHKNINAYYEAKKSIFFNNATKKCCAIINFHDEFGKKLYTEIPLQNKLFIGFDNLKRVNLTTIGTELFFNNETKIEIPLVGDFNVLNFLTAMACVEAIGIQFLEIFAAMKNFSGVCGRLQLVKLPQNISAFIDYAHTDDALINVGKTLQMLPHNRIITIFGCGGNRDKTKRPRMAKAAELFSDLIIVTSDNSRDEKTEDIFDDIAAGFSPNLLQDATKLIFVENRADAIKIAIENSQRNDIILVAGKGHENYQIINNEKHYFSDFAELQKFL